MDAFDDDPFEKRLKELNASIATVPTSERDAAVVIYERLVTARAICASVLGIPPPVPAVIAAFRGLCREVQMAQRTDGDTE